jgi:hypothetical protein
MAEQGCDKNLEVYRNQSPLMMVVTMVFTDACPDADSIVTVYSNHLPPLHEIDGGTVPDRQTRAFTFKVPPSGMIMFNCRGTGGGNPNGGCTWQLVSAVPG